MILINKIVFAAFCVFFLLVCHILYTSHGVVGLGLQQNNFTWMFVGVSLSLSCFVISKQKKIVIPDFWWKGTAFILLALLPFAFANKDYVSEGYLLPLGLVITWFFILGIIQFDLVRLKPDRLIILILCCITVEILWGGAQTFHAVMVNSTHEQLMIDPAALGVFNQRNTFGSFLATGLALSLYIFSRYKHDKSSFERVSYVWHLALASLAVFTLVFSNSRAAYLGALLGVIFVMPYALKKDKVKCLLWLASAFTGLIIALILLNHTGRVEKELADGGARVGMYITSLQAMLDAPIFGHGLGSFQRVFLEKFAELYHSGQLPEGSGHGNLVHPHNELLLWGFEGGLTAALSLVGLACICVSALWGKGLRFFSSIGVLLPIVLHSMVEMPFYQSALHLVVLAILFVCFLYTKDKQNVKQKVIYCIPSRLSFMPVIGGLLGSVFLTILSLNILSLNKLNAFLKDQNREVSDIQNVFLKTGWENTYNYIYFASISQIGIKSGQAELSQPYIEWATQSIRLAPKSDYYISLIYAYENTGQIKEAFKTADRLGYYYPSGRIKTWLESFYKHMESKGYKKSLYTD